jgi:hypothetical protein
MTTQTGLQSHIVETLGLNRMTEAEQSVFLEKIGAMAIESALLRFVVALTPAERMTFDAWLEEFDDIERLLPAAAERYPELAAILDEEVTAMHDAIQTMS